jgi:hypothetical protein
MRIASIKIAPLSVAFAVVVGCGGNVVVDGASSRGVGGGITESGSAGTSSIGNGGAAAVGSGIGGTTNGAGGSGVGGFGVGGISGVGGSGGATSATAIASTGVASSSSVTSSSAGVGGGPTGALWDILGLPQPPLVGGMSAPVIAVDASGDIFLAADYSVPIIFATPSSCAGEANILIAKVSASGQLLWSRCVTHTPLGDSPPSAWLHASSISVSENGTVGVLGSFTSGLAYGGEQITAASNGDSEMFVMSLDASSGAPIWMHGFDTRQGEGNPSWALAGDAEGNLYLSGYLYSSLDLAGITFNPTTGLGFVVAKLDPSGQAVWLTEVGNYYTIEGSTPLAPAVSPDGAHFAIATMFQGSADFGPGTRNDYLNPFVVELDTATGTIEWGFYPLGEEAQGQFTVAAFDGDDDLILGGTAQELDLGIGAVLRNATFLAKFDVIGDVVWQKRFNGRPSGLLGVAATRACDLLYAVWTNQTGIVLDGAQFPCPGNGSCLVIGSIDAGGTVGSAKMLITKEPTGVVAFGLGATIVAGSFKRTIDIGGGPGPSPPTGYDAGFLAALP